MSDLFLLFLKTTLTASVVALAILVLRLIFRRLGAPAKSYYLLWAVVLLRMVLPVGFGESTLSLLRWSAPAIESGVSALEDRYEVIRGTPDLPRPTAEAAEAAPPAEDNAAAPLPAASAPPLTPAERARQDRALRPASFPLLDLLGWIWLLGALSLWAYTLISYLRLRLKLRAAVRRTDGRAVWYESDRTASPFVLGFLPAKIYLPADLPDGARPYVLRHEQLHIRWGDHVVKAAAFLILALHWCNPLLWLCWRLLCRDIELSCDERVLAEEGAGDLRGAYSAALLALAAPKAAPPIPLAFGEVGVKERIRRVLGYRRPALWTVAAVAAAAVFSLLCLGCNPLLPELPGEPPELTVTGAFGTMTARADKRYWDGVTWDAPDCASWLLLGSTLVAPDYPDTKLQLRFPEGTRPPDHVEATDAILRYLEEGPAQSVPLAPAAGDGGYAMVLSLHPDTADPGGMEDRLVRVTCRWRSGADWVECQYVFLLQVPAMTGESIAAHPVVTAWDQSIGLDQGFSFAELTPFTGYCPEIPFGSYVHIAHPTDWDGGYELTCARLTEEGEVLEERAVMGGEPVEPAEGPITGGLSSSGFRLEPMEPGAERELLGFTLAYTRADGHEDVYRFVLEGAAAESCTPDLSVDESGAYLRYPGANVWTDLPSLLTAPAEWADQDLAGRNEAVSLGGLSLDFIEAGFSSPREGWVVVTLNHGVGANRDVYFYRTHDGGHTWTEYGRPQGRPFYVPTAAGFPTVERGFLAFGRFDVGSGSAAPVYGTEDGGKTWAELDLPLPEDGWDWECDSISFSDDLAYGLMTFNGGPARCSLISRDAGATWAPVSPRFASYPDGAPSTFSISEADLPTQIAASLPRDHAWDPVWLLGETGDIRLYGLNERVVGESALLLCRTGRLDTLCWYDEVTGYEESRAPSVLALGDYDGDGAEELAVSVYQGGGTGVSVSELCLFELDGGFFGPCAAFSEEVYGPLVEEALAGLGLDDVGYEYGDWITFELEDGRISMELMLDDPAVPPMGVYEADLRARVLYNGASFSLADVSVEPLK